MRHSKTSRSSSKLYIAIAITLLLIGMTLFLVILNDIYTRSGVAQLDIPMLNWMMLHRTPLITTLMQVVTNALSPIALGAVILTSATVWAFRKKEIWRPILLVGAMATSFVTSTLIKSGIERVRPPTSAMIPPLEIDFSFPSGHTLGIAVCLLVVGYLVYSRSPSIRNIATWVSLSVLGITLIAFSRMYLAYHWFTDVSASVALALIILAIVIILDRLQPSILADKKLLTKAA